MSGQGESSLYSQLKIHTIKVYLLEMHLNRILYKIMANVFVDLWRNGWVCSERYSGIYWHFVCWSSIGSFPWRKQVKDIRIWKEGVYLMHRLFQIMNFLLDIDMRYDSMSTGRMDHRAALMGTRNQWRRGMPTPLLRPLSPDFTLSSITNWSTTIPMYQQKKRN